MKLLTITFGYFLFLGILSGGASEASLPSPSLPIEVLVDGHLLPPSDSPPNLTSQMERVTFRFPPFHSQFDSDFIRLRYQLEGYDTDWRQVRGSVQIVTIFYNADDLAIEQRTHEGRDRSPGWNDDLEQAVFNHRRDSVVVPENARKLGFEISSASTPANVGVYLVKDLKVTRVGEKKSNEIIFDGRPLLPPATGPRPGMPAWIQDGTHPSMAQIIPLKKDKVTEAVLAIVDNDIGGYAAWRSSVTGAPQVASGQTLSIEWDELFNAATANISYVNYFRLAPGHYNFKVQAVDVWGRPLGEETQFPFLVHLPFWQGSWFIGLCAVLGNLLLIVAGRYLLLTKARRQFERTRLVEKERFRIAQDLHDDLGARLTHISLLSSHAARSAVHPESLESFHEISHMTRELVAALSETVWAVNPQNDNLESLVGFLCRTIDSQCKAAGIRCRIDALALADQRMVSSDVRHQVILAVKEALNNAFKHAGTTEILASISFHETVLCIAIRDHGVGFSPETILRGNGLHNMERRMEAVKGSVSLESKEGEGTLVTFQIPIP